MQKIMVFIAVLLFLSCDDGDIQIETLDFDSANIEVCDNNPVEPNSENVLFKLNDTEALILELPGDVILSEVSADSLERSINTTQPPKLTFRVFSDNVSSDYFCSDIPVTEPTVIEEIIAEGGSVYISTVISSDSINYEHTISLGNIVLIASDGSQIADLSINNFGTVTTTVPVEEE